MTSRSFRRLFPQLNVQSIPEDEFYRQAILSQLLTGPDEQELSSFRPDVKDPLELVEATPELAGMLGSSLEFVDSRWDSLEGSPPPSPPPPPSPRPSPRLSPRPLQRTPPLLLQVSTEAIAKVDMLQNRTAESGHCQGLKNLEHSTPAPKMEARLDISMWEPLQQESKNVGIPSPAKPKITNSSVWEPQRQQSKNTGITNSANPDSSIWEIQRLQSKNAGIANSANPDSKMDTNTWEQKPQCSKDSGMTSNLDSKVNSNTWEPKKQSKNTWITNSANGDFRMDSSMWEPQKQQSKNTGKINYANPDSKMDTSMWEQKRQHSKDPGMANSANVDSKIDSNTWEPQRQQSTNTEIADSAKADSKMDSNVWEQHRHGSNITGIMAVKSNAAVGASIWEPQRLRSRNTGNSDITVDDSLSEPQRIRNRNNGNSRVANLNGAVDPSTWKRQNQGSKTGGGSTHPGASIDSSIWEPQRLRSKNAVITSSAKSDTRVNANTWENQGIKRVGGSSTAPKREANSCDNQGGKNIKMDAAWHRNLGNVRVNVRDLGVKGGGSVIRRDVKKEQGKVAGKGAKVKTRS